MTGNAAAFHQNFNSEKKNNDIVEKDIRKWVESVVEFKAKLDKQKGELPLEKHLKKNKKFKNKKKPGLVLLPVGSIKPQAPGQQHKTPKSKNSVKKVVGQQPVEKSTKKDTLPTVDAFDSLKESYRNIKLPPNWTSGLSNNRIIFNRVKITVHNAQQKMLVDRSLVITKDRNLHVLINGLEVALGNWEIQKVDTLEDVKRAIKDVDTLKLCEGSSNGMKSPQCSVLVFNKLKVCEACKSDTTSPPKTTKKKTRAKKSGAPKVVAKQKSFQN